jgi:hypothetical protein
LNPAVPVVDPSTEIGRTREGIIGGDRQLMGDLHTTVDFIYRYYDKGSATYDQGLEPMTSGCLSVDPLCAKYYPIENVWTNQVNYTDPVTGSSTTYYLPPANYVFPLIGPNTGNGNTITSTSLTYTTYHGVTWTLVKRYSHKWQGNLSYTWNDARNFEPYGSFGNSGTTPGNPTGVNFVNGQTSGTLAYTVKAFASVELPWWGLLAGMNFNWNAGAVRNLTINGPGTVESVPANTGIAGYSGYNITYNTLAFQDTGTTKLPPTKDLDVNVSKTVSFGKRKLYLTLDCFNVFNVNTILGYSSGDIDNNGQNGASGTFLAINSIIPPRVFRVDARFTF